MPKKDHTQDFLNALKEELKKDKPPKDPRTERILERMKFHGRNMPPSMVLLRLSHLNRRNRNPIEEETWVSFARQIYDFWIEENYPNEPDEPNESEEKIKNGILY